MTTHAIKATRSLRSADEVMTEVNERVPHLVPHCFMDRSWIWVCGVDLRGKDNEPVRTALKEIGFRFSPAPHVMPDGETTGHWAHSCTRPMHNKRRRRDQSKLEQPEDPMAAELRALGL